MPHRMSVPLYLALNALAGLLLIGGTSAAMGAGRDFRTTLPLLLGAAILVPGLVVLLARGRTAQRLGLGVPGLRSRLGGRVALRPFEADARALLGITGHVASILVALWLVGRVGGLPTFPATPMAIGGIAGYALLYRLLRPLDERRSLGTGGLRSRADERASS